MQRDATIVQIALWLIILAVIGVAILQQRKRAWSQATTVSLVQEAVVSSQQETSGASEQDGVVDFAQVDTQSEEVEDATVEYINSPRAKLVKKYFAHVANREYTQACALMTNTKCSERNSSAIDNFSREFEKLTNWYEYVSVKDYGFVAPSGRNVVCVKYNYRYKDDRNPSLVSEILSFYMEEEGWELKISDRVCEKKYKEWRWLRDCPVQAAVEFCEGWVK